MAIPPRITAAGGGGRKPRVPPLPPARTLLTAFAAAAALAVLCLVSSSPAASLSGSWRSGAWSGDKYLYWAAAWIAPANTAAPARGSGTRSPASAVVSRRPFSLAGNKNYLTVLMLTR